MNKFQLFFTIIAISFFSCNEDLSEKIVSSYPDGTPSKIEYYKYQGDFEVLVKHIRFYEGGEKKEEGEFKNSLRDGNWTYWYDNGEIWSKGQYTLGERNGETKVYFKSGKPQYFGYYVNGEADGKWTFWDGEGIKVKEVFYENGTKIKEVNVE